MKILQLVQTLDPHTGGVAKAVAQLSNALVRQGHTVEIVCLDEPGAPWLATETLPVHALDQGLTSYRFSSKLLPWLDAHGADFDCAIVNGMWQYLGFAAWRRFADSATPYFVFPHGMLDPWFKRTYPLKHLKKWLYWPWADYRVLRDARAVIFTSEEEKFAARESFWLYRCAEKVTPLGVEIEHGSQVVGATAFSEKFPALSGQRFLLFLGRLHVKKGCDLIIEAFAKIETDPALMLVFAGPDQVGWEERLRLQAARSGAGNRIVFTGMLEGDVKCGAFESADAFILPSHQENFGMAVAEALSFGLPVLISNQVNIWREIEADRAGFVEADDLAGTSRLLARWLAAPEDERARMRANARRCFQQRFEIGQAATSLVTLLRSCGVPK